MSPNDLAFTDAGTGMLPFGDYDDDLTDAREPGIELESAQDGQEVGYVSRWFVQCLFPYKQISERQRVVTDHGDEIMISSLNGLPFGKYSRLLMAFIITLSAEQAGKMERGELTADEARVIHLGNSMSDFLRCIGVKNTRSGGADTPRGMVREQLERLMTSTITVQRRNQSKNNVRGVNAPLTEKYDLWFDPHDPDQLTLEESTITLSSAFFREISKAPIPIDMTVLKNLRKPRAMDIYVFLALKKFWLAKTKKELYTFNWHLLEHNFSTKELTTAVQRRDFRNEVTKCMDVIRRHWPEVGVDVTKEGLTVHAGPTPVPMKYSRRGLV